MNIKHFFQTFKHMELPEDLLLNKANIRLVEHCAIAVDNYQSIKKFSDSCAIIKTKTGFLEIAGKNLRIIYYTDCELKLEGLILSIQFIV